MRYLKNGLKIWTSVKMNVSNSFLVRVGHQKNLTNLGFVKSLVTTFLCVLSWNTGSVAIPSKRAAGSVGEGKKGKRSGLSDDAGENSQISHPWHPRLLIYEEPFRSRSPGVKSVSENYTGGISMRSLSEDVSIKQTWLGTGIVRRQFPVSSTHWWCLCQISTQKHQ